MREIKGKYSFRPTHEDGCEINITVVVKDLFIFNEKQVLKEITMLALGKGYSRFSGIIDNEEEADTKLIDWVFVFSKPDYFDKDDWLLNKKLNNQVNELISEIKEHQNIY